MFWKKINWKLPILLLGSLVLRLSMVTNAINLDLIDQAGWGKWIHEHGWLGFYENNIWIYRWPNHPPLISLGYGFSFTLFEWLNTIFTNIGNFIALNHLGATKISWFYNFEVWFFTKKYLETPFTWGQLISMKLVPIIADLVLGILIYKFVEKVTSPKMALLAAALYLLSPFSWYESALWGQNDQIGIIFLLLSFWFLTKDKWPWLSPILLAISVGLKPTSFIFGPMFVWFALKNKRRFINVVIGGIVTLILYFVLAKFTSGKDVFAFTQMLQTKLFVRGEWWTWINSFNFWRLVTGFNTNFQNTFLWINYKIWGYIIYAGFNLYVFYRYRARDWQSGLKALFILAFSGWLFMVTMHERYFFTGVVVGLILSCQNPKMLRYWLVLSLIFMVNIYTGQNSWLRNILNWGSPIDGYVPKFLSLVNLVIFGKMLILTSKLTSTSMSKAKVIIR